jgi:hypothetical protein
MVDRVLSEPGWCPNVERQNERERAEAACEQLARRVTFAAYADDYLAWAKLHHKGWETEASRIGVMKAALGASKLN